MRILGILMFISSLLVGTVVCSKEVAYRGGLIVFEVPNGWAEEYEPDGGGMFYSKEPNAGTLRLNVLTIKAKSVSIDSTPAKILGGIKELRRADIHALPNGNAIGEWVQRTTEGGHKITLYWWHVASLAPEGHYRIANFSYAVLSSEDGTPQVNSDLTFLRASFERARFSPQLGK